MELRRLSSVSYQALSTPQTAERGRVQTTSPLSATQPIESLDKIDIGDFSVTTPFEELLPQSKEIDTKKHFKSMKEYIAYILMLHEKIDKIKPGVGPEYVKMEDKQLLAKLEGEFKDLTTSWIV